jgi:hypothetical protein
MTGKAKKKNKQEILDIYMEYVESHGIDISVEDFCSDTHLDKYNFYDYFDSTGHIESSVWESLLRASVHTVTQDELFNSLPKRDQLLSLYYTFFENCELNSSFLTLSIDGHGRWVMVKVLAPMKEVFIAFIDQLDIVNSCGIGGLDDTISKISDKVSGEGFYGQLLFLLDFWHNDDSPEKEKTDVAIEKAVKATMDLLDITPLKSVFDFGKFIFQERFSKKA